MAKESIKMVITKIMEDADFRASLLSDPAQALAEFDLTAEEKEQLSSLDADMLEAEDLEERISRWGAMLGGGV